MTEPVAEVVELAQKLRARADTIVAAHEAKGRKIERPFCLEDLAADLLERLSRERDTGVPEGFWLAPNELTREMIRAVIPMYDAMIEGSEWPFTKNLYATLRAAAPQPPTVSTQGWQPASDLTGDDQPNERQWLLSQAPKHRRPGDEDILPVRAEASQAACEIIADILRIGSDVGPNGEIIISDAARFRMAHRLAHIAETGVLVDEAPATKSEPDVALLTRERDQAREALAWYGEQARLARLIHSEGDPGRHALEADGGKRARSVLENAV